jgi:SAM-dependent methyltransferase
MRRDLLEHLWCRQCECGFELHVLEETEDHVSEGLLRCKKSQHLYPVVRSVPRILSGAFEQEAQFSAKYREFIGKPEVTRQAGSDAALTEKIKLSFGRQWTTYQVQRPEEDNIYFRSKTATDPTSLRGKLVLDAGCGSGRYTRIVGDAKASVIGVDLSPAVETAALNTARLSNVHIIQADVFELPVAHQTFDFIFSIGVLDHTPDTKRAISSLIPLLADNGEIAIWVYPRWPIPFEIYNRLLRAITTRMSLDSLHKMAVALEPVGLLKLRLLTAPHLWKRVIGQFLRGLTIGVSYHPDREIRICDTFDWFSPPYQWHHTDKEIESWFREFGLVDIKNLSIGQIHYRYNYGNGVNFKARRSLATGGLSCDDIQ